MKPHSFIVPMIISLLMLSSAQAQDENLNVDMKNLYQQELQRYQRIYQREASGALLTPTIDAKYYRLDLKVTTSPQYLRGTVLMNAASLINGLGTITLDLMNALTVDSVRVGGVRVSFLQSTSSFDVTLDRTYNTGELMTVEVFYQGVPGSSGFGSFEFSSHLTTPWVWSLSEPYGAKDWWPCNDHPLDKADSADIFITCDTAYKAGSNGKLLSVVNNGDGTSTHHWNTLYPISTYLISIALTNYSAFSNWFKYSPTDSMEVLNYVLPEHLSSALSGLPRAIDGLEVFSDLFGLYPFINEKYGHAEFGWGGGMEHQTMTYLGGFSEFLVIHELSHQWFGDMITCRTWPDLWLNEGFATYCEALFAEKKYGTGSYWSEVNGDMNSAKNAVGTLYLQDTSSVGNMFSGSRVYAKGGTVLHMLRHVIGDTAFFHAMYNYANDPRFKYGTASTADFQSVCETASGMNLDFFFDEWVFGEKYPRYKYGWTSEPYAGGYKVTLGVSQTTNTSNPTYFTMPIDIKLYSSGWDTTVVVFNDQLSQTFEIEIPHAPTSLQFDPMGWIMKTKDSLKTFTVSPTSKNFKNVNVNFNKTDSITVYNTGLTTLDISSVVADNSDYTVTPLTATILPAQNLKFYITFTPGAEGVGTGLIYFYHNAPTSPDQITVTGTGVVPSVNVVKGWNIVSLPSSADDPRKASLFPTAIAGAFSYSADSGYMESDSLHPGTGYWLKFNTDQAIPFGGKPPLADTIDVAEGWNMIGSTLNKIGVGSIQSIPADNVLSNYFYYNSSYSTADSLTSGKGYWVKVNQAGKLVLGSSALAAKMISQIDELSRLSTLRISDAKGNSQVLYFGKRVIALNVNRFELPPLPPDGIFDVRFSSGRNLEVTESGEAKEFSIRISALDYPLTVEWEMKHSDLPMTLTIDKREISMNEYGTTQIAHLTSRISLSSGVSIALPDEFALDQNHPNPFNPSTVIRYQLPVSSRVTLKVFDLLGREVVTLIDGTQPAGYQSVTFNAENLPSGLYFYRLQTDKHSFVRKMLIQK